LRTSFGKHRDHGEDIVFPRDERTIVAEPTHPLARQLFSFWHARPEGGLVIGRDFPTRAVAGLLPNVTVWEQTADGKDYRVRLAGVATRERFEEDVTGKLFSELFPPEDFRKHFADTVRLVKADRPQVVDSRLYDGNVMKLHQEVVILPVLAPNLIDKWVLVGSFFFR
jgi:hypothetical protein